MSKIKKSMALAMQALHFQEGAQWITSKASNPVEVKNKPQKGGNQASSKKEARFFFGIKRSISFCGFRRGALRMIARRAINPVIYY